MAMPQLGRFYSYNIANDDQRDRLHSVGVSLSSIAPGHDHLFNTYSLYQDINQRISGSRPRPTLLDRNSRDTITLICALGLQLEATRGDPKKILMKTSILDLRASDVLIVQFGEIFHQSCNQISYG